jgi:hypothetical protein
MMKLRMRWAGHVARMGKVKDFHGKARSKEATRRRCEDNIKLDLRRDWVVCTGLVLLRIETSGRLL